MYDSSFYWSESQRQNVEVATMPLPYARNVLHKLLRDDEDEFRNSPLFHALMQRLRPSRGVIISLLAQQGAASFYLYPGEYASARKRFKRLEKVLGTTVNVTLAGDFL